MTIKKEIFDKVGLFKEDKISLSRGLIYGLEFLILERRLITYLNHWVFIERYKNMSKSKEFTKRIINIHKNHSRYFHSKGIISTADIKNWEFFLLVSNFISHPLKENLISICNYLINGGLKYLFSYSFIKIFFRLIFRKIHGIMLTLFKYKRLKCIAKELL